jgi:hypothetical protein
MKFVLAAFVFILALGLSVKSIASETETCTAEKTENCTAPHETEKHGEAKEGHDNLNAEMNSLFPEKQKNAALADRPAVTKLTTPKFLAKVNGATTKLEWTAIPGATNYHVQVATDPNFKWLIANDHWVKTNSFDVANLQADQKYYWRVATVKDQNDSMSTKSLFVSSAFSTSAK